MAEEKIPRKKECGLSRREFLIDAGLITGGVFLGASALSLAGCGTETVTTTVTAPGATTTVTAPGATTTVTAPGATTTVTAPGATTTVTAPGATTTVTAPGAAAIPGLITLHVNGKDYLVKVKNNWTLAYVLREKLGLTGTKRACDMGDCGLCTVIMSGRPVLSCITLAIEASDQPITTVEGLALGDSLDPLQQAFMENDALQCGFCTPGQIMTAKALLAFKPNPAVEEIREFMAGTLCRCGAHPNIVKAIQAVAK